MVRLQMVPGRLYKERGRGSGEGLGRGLGGYGWRGGEEGEGKGEREPEPMIKQISQNTNQSWLNLGEGIFRSYSICNNLATLLQG